MSLLDTSRSQVIGEMKKMLLTMDRLDEVGVEEVVEVDLKRERAFELGLEEQILLGVGVLQTEFPWLFVGSGEEVLDTD